MADTTHRENVDKAKSELQAVLDAYKDVSSVDERSAAEKAAYAWANSWGALLVRDAEILNECVTEMNMKGYTLDAIRKQD